MSRDRLSLSLLTVSNLAVLGLGVLTPIAAITTYVLTQEAERAKDRQLQRFKIEAQSRIEEARTRAEEARARAAAAQANADNAKLETARINERLVQTQSLLDAANVIEPFTRDQLDRVGREMLKVKNSDWQIIIAAGNDLQSQRRAVQLTELFLKSAIPLSGTASGPFTPLSEQSGDVSINFWADEQRNTAELIATAFRKAGLQASTYSLPPDPMPGAVEATRKLILIAVPVRKPRPFLKR